MMTPAWRRAARRVALLVPVLAAACSEGPTASVESEPAAGTLTLLWTVPRDTDRAVVLTLSGPGVERIETANPNYLVVARPHDGIHRIAVFGTLASGPVLRFAVPDTNRPDLYDITVMEVGDANDNVRTFPADYTVTLRE